MASKTITNDTKPLDARVDAVFGEQVVLKPMKTQGGGYRDSVPDDSRLQVIATGIYDQTRGAVEETGGSFMHKQATVGTTLSIRMEPLQQCDLRKGDRVFFAERNETYDVTYIHAEPGGRPEVHLVRVLEEE
jgi:hypothetical protein